MSPLLEAKGLRCAFKGGIEAVKGFDRAVEPGDLVGLIGPVGAGKTTTCRSIRGLQKPSGGQVGMPAGPGTHPGRVGWLSGQGRGGADDRQCVRTIHMALDQGINLIDTAPVHGVGHTEEVVGRALSQDGRRKRTVLATKSGLELLPPPAFVSGTLVSLTKQA